MISFTFTSLLLTALLATSVHGYGPTPEPYYDTVPSTSAPVTNCDKKNTIVAAGVGRSSVKTTIAVISLGIQAKGKTAVIAQGKLTEKSNTLKKYLLAQKVDKLSISGVYLYGEYNYNNPTPELVAYSASITLTFEVPTAKSSTILDEAVRTGANQVSGVTYKAAPSVQAEARDAAIRDAIKKAKEEAAVAVKALQRKLGKAVSVKITDTHFSHASNSNSYSPYGPGGYVPPSIASSEQIITAAVSVSYHMW